VRPSILQYQTSNGTRPVAEWLDGLDGNSLIVLLCGGTKRAQAKDVEKAHAYWKDYKTRIS
jgi:hypothetical protein